MSFTMLFAIFVPFVLALIFGLTYKIKGLKIALVTTAAAFIAIAILFAVVVYAIVSVMPN